MLDCNITRYHFCAPHDALYLAIHYHAVTPMPSSPPLLPARYSPRFTRGFLWYARRLIRKRFHAVRICNHRPESGGLLGSIPPTPVPDGAADPPQIKTFPDAQDAAVSRSTDPAAALTELDGYSGPVLVVLHHTSWWDPLIGLLVSHKLAPGRVHMAPMDIAQLQNFKFLTRLGAFGINPDDPATKDVLLEYVRGYFASTAHPTLWITPQGRFCDPRRPLVIRPGAAAIAACTPAVRVVSVALEYAFWLDQSPEAFVRIATVTPPLGSPSASTTAWHRCILQSMEANASELARSVIARDPAGFTPLIGAGSAKINPMYDLWKKMTGQRNVIDESARSERGLRPAVKR